MSNNSISMYKLKPFEFTEKKNNRDAFGGPYVLNKVVCSDAYFIAYGLNMNDIPFHPRELLWKYCFVSDEWRIISCNDIPQYFKFSSIILFGSIIIIIGWMYSPREFSGHRMYIGNLDDEYKEYGIPFEELEVSGDLPLYDTTYSRPCILMDGQYVYTIGKRTGDQMMVVHRLNLSTRKWELLHKSCVEYSELDYHYQHEAVFYQGVIYVFGYERKDHIVDDYTFLKLYKFDVANKTWEIIPVNTELWPLLHYRRSLNCFSCVQCPEKSNLVYIFGTSLGGICRFNIDNLQWEKLKWTFPLGIYFQSTAVTPSGRMYCYDNPMFRFQSAWLTVPKLKVISWEAMIHYFKEHMFASSDEYLKEIGLPKEFYERIIEARRTKIL